MAKAFEIHIAVESTGLSAEQKAAVVAALIETGIREIDYFLAVTNLWTPTMGCHPNGSVPTGHDLSHPWLMATATVDSLEESIELVRAGMEKLRSLGAVCNFEIEKVISDGAEPEPTPLVITGYRAVGDSPAFENHLAWRGRQNELPDVEQVESWVKQHTGETVHQIVDFIETPDPNDETIVCRVGTIYQPTAEAVRNFAQRFSDSRSTWEYPPDYVIAEQVILVGEPDV